MFCIGFLDVTLQLRSNERTIGKTSKNNNPVTQESSWSILTSNRKVELEALFVLCDDVCSYSRAGCPPLVAMVNGTLFKTPIYLWKFGLAAVQNLQKHSAPDIGKCTLREWTDACLDPTELNVPEDVKVETSQSTPTLTKRQRKKLQNKAFKALHKKVRRVKKHGVHLATKRFIPGAPLQRLRPCVKSS